jgi:hypothetical protein
LRVNSRRWYKKYQGIRMRGQARSTPPHLLQLSRSLAIVTEQEAPAPLLAMHWRREEKKGEREIYAQDHQRNS